MELIKATDLTLAYDGHTAAENVNFTLHSGDYLCVIGENGSGKSTLLKAITGEVTPAGGILAVSAELKRSGIGYLPQQSKIQHDFPASVSEVILSGCVRSDSFGFAWKKQSRSKAKAAMELLGITPLASRCFGELSGGQKQRVLLARAICVSDKLLLLDEPVTGLDPDAAHEMYAAIRQINEKLGCAVMMVSHDVNCALHEAKNVLSMCRGHSFFGTVDEYAVHEQHDAAIDHELHHGHNCHCDHTAKEKGDLT
ncbi:MAG: ABC transporter ATP-binding protein [Ruminococcaceae bacterium]|nr:ABC transporter ATP-binding protein [Oscillospiraceae bacterium]